MELDEALEVARKAARGSRSASVVGMAEAKQQAAIIAFRLSKRPDIKPGYIYRAVQQHLRSVARQRRNREKLFLAVPNGDLRLEGTTTRDRPVSIRAVESFIKSLNEEEQILVTTAVEYFDKHGISATKGKLAKALGWSPTTTWRVRHEAARKAAEWFGWRVLARSRETGFGADPSNHSEGRVGSSASRELRFIPSLLEGRADHLPRR